LATETDNLKDFADTPRGENEFARNEKFVAV
jgi:hypothetical protein